MINSQVILWYKSNSHYQSIILHRSAWAIKRKPCLAAELLPSYPWVPEMFTSKMAADMPSETELLTTAKHLFMAAWSSCWLLSWARKTPAVLQKTAAELSSAWLRAQRGVNDAKGQWQALGRKHTAALCVTCTQGPGKSPNQRGQLPAAETFVVV